MRIAWVVVLQAAKARRDLDLREVVTRCHENAMTRAKWVRRRR